MGLEKPRASVFFPLRAVDYASPSLQGVTLMVRARGGDVLGAVRREVQAMDAKLTPFNGHSMTEQLEHNMSLIRVAVWTYGSVGIFGLILAAVGLAGVTAYSVAQRGREIGIRVALGAGKGDLLGLVMKEGATLIMVGSAIGLACAWGATRVLAAFMSAISRTVTTSTSDPVLLVGAPLLLAGLALAACYLPARKSMRIDPAVALRQE